jgi:GNAT superfamily N-acetyltransferase
MPERLTIELLDPALHDREAFSCGKPGIDRYFREVAAQASGHLRSRTYVLCSADPPEKGKKAVLGFYTLTPHEYRDDEMDPVTARALKAQSLQRIPAVLLGQLAIASEHQGKKLGPMLLDHAFRTALFACCKVGGMLLVTDPIDDGARAFYVHFDFQAIPGTDRLFIAIKTIARIYPDVVEAAKAAG